MVDDPTADSLGSAASNHAVRSIVREDRAQHALVPARFRRRAHELGVPLTVAADVDVLIEAADMHVEHVLDNLVDDALVASRAGGHVAVDCNARSDAHLVDVHVVDDGPGLDDDELELVFQRFHSGADRPRQSGDGGGGFGLGLAIARRLIELDGGTVQLRRRADATGIDAVATWRRAPSSAPGPAS